jgi:hypothetical protein
MSNSSPARKNLFAKKEKICRAAASTRPEPTMDGVTVTRMDAHASTATAGETNTLNAN